MRRFVLVSAVLMFLFLVPPALAQQSVTVAGVLTDAASGDPLSGRVEAVHFTSGAAFVSDRGPAGPDGRFALSLPDQPLLLFAWAPGYPPLRLFGPAAPCSGCVLELRPLRALRGRLLDLDGSPLVGVAVSARYGWPRGRYCPAALARALDRQRPVTGPDGGFGFTGVVPGIEVLLDALLPAGTALSSPVGFLPPPPSSGGSAVLMLPAL